VAIEEDVCRIEVADAGPPFDPGVAGPWLGDGESGRGISLMRALVDDLKFESRSEGGTLVTLRKTLALHPASMLRRLVGGDGEAVSGDGRAANP
jgi:serine/threonine-protein kinase RsbW